jgi:crotonobetainyl-CoA:carnitine CoA-transferase CaiB-like acyl-CoA transferase
LLLSRRAFFRVSANAELQAPLLGEHNVEVLGRHLGYSRAQVEELESKGVIKHEMR